MKRTGTKQVWAGASVAPVQVSLTSMNTPGLLKVAVRALTVALTVPLLRTVSDCNPLCVPATIEPKLSVAGVTVIAGNAAAVPVPERSMFNGAAAVPLLVESIFMKPEYVCAAIGLKLTANVHGVPSVTPAAQVPPVMDIRDAATAGVIAVILAGTAPTKVTVNTCDVVLPTTLLPNANGEAGLTESTVRCAFA